MAHLACVGSRRVNGVAALHSRLLRERVLGDFDALYPDKFINVTNGVTPRRFVALGNRPLAALITETIGEGWLRDLERLRELEDWADDPAVRAAWRAVKLTNKQRLSQDLRRGSGIEADPESLFDIQVKRLHEYKRQHLSMLHVISRYLYLKEHPGASMVPRTWVFAGKAAPGYRLAKLVIELINSVAQVVNGDPDAAPYLRVAFLPNFNVKSAQRIYPAADLSEQISTAGKEASGTGNMKFALNGALTIGTLDGANVEIREAVGPENFFLFGLTEAEVAARHAAGYRPRDLYESDPSLRGAIDAVAAGRFSGDDPGRFQPLVDALLERDEYLVMADFASYCECQRRVDRAWREADAWTRMSILNTARSGRFSSDRAIAEYCEKVWRLEPQPVERGTSAWGPEGDPARATSRQPAGRPGPAAR
jgi:starch phosphorylase